MKTEISDIELINSSNQILEQLVEICNGKEGKKEFTEADKILYKTVKIKQASEKAAETRISK